MATHEIITLSTTSATRLTPPGTHSGMDITIQNINNTGFIYIGAEGVTSTDFGYRLDTNNAISFELTGVDALYAIAGDAGSQIAVFKIMLESAS